MSVAIVTCHELPEPDHDEDLLLDALACADVDASLAAWDDPTTNWDDFDLAVLRSPWNYIANLDAFLDWAEATGTRTRLLNAVEVVRWNTHKGYLRDLADEGVPIVPTAWVVPGSGGSGAAPETLADIMAAGGWHDVVAKPVIGAGSYLTDRVTDPSSPAATDLWRRLLAHGDVMVQPYLTSVEEYGERSLVWIDGEFTHAIRKSPRLGDAAESVSEALPIADDELALATAVIDAVRARPTGCAPAPESATGDGDSPWRELLYARVDLIRGEEGQPLLAELELVEPSLFLLQSPMALNRLVRAIATRATG